MIRLLRLLILRKDRGCHCRRLVLNLFLPAGLLTALPWGIVPVFCPAVRLQPNIRNRMTPRIRRNIWLCRLLRLMVNCLIHAAVDLKFHLHRRFLCRLRLLSSALSLLLRRIDRQLLYVRRLLRDLRVKRDALHMPVASPAGSWLPAVSVKHLCLPDLSSFLGLLTPSRRIPSGPVVHLAALALNTLER